MSSLSRRVASLASRDPVLKDVLRGVLASSQKPTRKRASLDRRTLSELVADAAERLGYDGSEAQATLDVEQAAKKFTRGLSQALSVWTQKNPPKGDATVSDLMRAEGAYVVYMTLDGAGVGVWDGRWRRFYDDTRNLERFLEKALKRSFNALQEAIQDAAWETAGEED